MFEELDKIVQNRCRLTTRQQIVSGGLTKTKQVERLASKIQGEKLKEPTCEPGCCKCNKVEAKNKALETIVKADAAVEFNILKSGLEEQQTASVYQKLKSQLNQAIKDQSVDPIPEGAELVEALKKEVELAYDDHKKQRDDDKEKLKERVDFLEGQREQLRGDIEYRKTTEIVLAKREMEALDELEKVEDEKQKIVVDKALEIEELNRERQDAVALEELKQETTGSLQNTLNMLKKTLTPEQKELYSPFPVMGLKGLEKKEAIINNIAQLLNAKDEKVDSYIEVKTVVDDVDDYLLDIETGAAVDETLDQVVNEIVGEVGEEFE